MIYYPSIPENSPSDPLIEHLAAQMASWCGEEGLVGSGQVDELACAVARFVEGEAPSDAVDSGYLVMLASRALSAIGENQAAQRMLLYGTGLVRPSHWEVTGGDAMWVLDLKEMTVLSDTCLEMVFFNCLVLILDSIAEVWDETGGSGVLGLRHVLAAARGLSGTGADGGRERSRSLSEEIKRVCARKLEMLGQQRQWITQPVIMDLDLKA